MLEEGLSESVHTVYKLVTMYILVCVKLVSLVQSTTDNEHGQLETLCQAGPTLFSATTCLIPTFPHSATLHFLSTLAITSTYMS